MNFNSTVTSRCLDIINIVNHSKKNPKQPGTFRLNLTSKYGNVFINIVCKYMTTESEVTKFTTYRPLHESDHLDFSQELSSWHLYVFALRRQGDGLSSNDWQFDALRRPLPSHAVDSSWHICAPNETGHHSSPVTPVFWSQVNNGQSPSKVFREKLYLSTFKFTYTRSLYSPPNGRSRGALLCLTPASSVWPNPEISILYG